MVTGDVPAATDTSGVQRRTVRALAGAQVLGGTGVGATIPVAALLGEQLSGSSTWAGFAPTMITLGAGVVALPLARLAAARGRRVALSTGWILGGTGGLVAVVAAALGWFPLLLGGMLLFGSGNAANLQSRYAATDLATDAHRGRALSVVVWATTIGAVLGPNLIDPGIAFAGWLGLPSLSGSLVFSVLAFGVGAAVMWATLRPDPLLLARRIARGATASQPRRRGGLGRAFAAVRSSRSALLGLVAVALAHTVMVGVMTMTPVHMRHAGTGIAIVGFTISLHVAGMYALSPLMGLLTDRFGRVRLIVGGQLILVAATVVAGTSGDSVPRIVLGLFLIGLGWSATIVSGSTLLAESVPLAERPSVQGLSDLAMNVVGATGSALSGTVLAYLGYGGLNAAAGFLVTPVIVLAVAVAFFTPRIRRIGATSARETD